MQIVYVIWAFWKLLKFTKVCNFKIFDTIYGNFINPLRERKIQGVVLVHGVSLSGLDYQISQRLTSLRKKELFTGAKKLDILVLHRFQIFPPKSEMKTNFCCSHWWHFKHLKYIYKLGKMKWFIQCVKFWFFIYWVLMCQVVI